VIVDFATDAPRNDLLDALLDEYEPTGLGLRELSQHFDAASTIEACLRIAAEAARRRARPELQPPVEAGYGVLAHLARRRAAAIAQQPHSEGGAGCA
jgi:hypothetical protein